ncbi:MAG: hypothetical protein P4L87_03400 [Formivibrio sp.]|nr:hypothetical protein [Formivibrio sp.]
MSASIDEKEKAPARLTVEQVARRLNCSVESVYILTKRRLLKPLGHPSANCTRYYARCYIERLEVDEAWLARMSDVLVEFKWNKNHGKADES